jgi:dihydrodipicolinate synthase/N-acetylneuraminate lyase
VELERLRSGLERFPFPAAAKHAPAWCDVSLNEAVRAPLRPVTESERLELDAWLESS